jgi:hypothetical protein
MKTRFYERTAYRLSEQPIPACFIALDDQFGNRLSSEIGSPLHFSIVLAESICARMADIEMYAFLMEDARARRSLAASEMDHESDLKAAVMTRSFLIGYLGACRGLLDSSALALVTLCDLPLVGSACSFQNSEFWRHFVSIAPNVHRRYHPLRLFFGEVDHWCSETAQRIVPVTVIEHHYGSYSRRDTLTQVLDSAEIDTRSLAADAIGRPWIDPLSLHTRWKPEFLTLCEKLCRDIADRIPPLG